MKICILTPRFPFPENGGDVLRINNIARYLKSKNHEVILVSYDSFDANYESCNELYNKVFCTKRKKSITLINSLLFFLTRKPIQCGYYYSKQYLKLLKTVVNEEKPDLYISHLLRMVPYLEKLNLYKNSIVEMTDALSKTYMLSTNSDTKSIKKVIYKIEKSLIQRYESKVIKSFPKIVLVSENDIKYLCENNTEKNDNLVCYTNGVTCYNNTTSNYMKKISFVGNMRTLQNQDAVYFFINEIFPLILKRYPDVLFEIVGAEPPDSIRNLENKNVKITGFVESVEETIKDSCLVVAPVKIAAGIQNKVLIAMACKIPIVLTSLISKAIPELIDGENCFIKDNAEAFADSCIKLLENSELRNQIAENGFQLVRDNYSWNAKLSGYENIYF